MERMIRLMAECTLTMSAIATALLLLTPWLSRHYSAKTLRIAWLIVLMGFVVPFRPQIAPAAINVPVLPSRVVYVPRRIAEPITPPVTTLTTQAGRMANTDDVSVASVDVMAASSSVTTPVASSVDTQNTPRFTWPELTVSHLLGGIWLIGMLIALALRMWKHKQFLRVVRRWSRPIHDTLYHDALDIAARKLGLHRGVGLYHCPAIDSPMLVGLIRPRILLPGKPQSLTELDLILKHELVHLRRGDLWGKLLLLIATCAHWFNPLMWPIGRAFSLTCEEACDAAVIHGMDFDMRKYYSHTILRSLRRPTARMKGRTTALSTQYRAGKKTMKKRLVHILDGGRKRLGMIIVSMLLVAVLGGGMALALSSEGTVDMLTGVNARAAVLNEQLGRLLTRIYLPLHTVDPDIGSYVFAADTFTQEEYDDLSAQITACERDYFRDDDGKPKNGYEAGEEGINAAYRLLKSLDLRVQEPTDTIVAFVDEVLTAAGHTGFKNRAYRYTIWSGADGAYARGWEVTATDGDPLDLFGARAYLRVIGDDQLVSLHSAYPSDFEIVDAFVNVPRDPLTPETRETIKSRATAFYEQYMCNRGEKADIVLVSDYALGDADALVKSFVKVWISAPTSYDYFDLLPLVPYNEADHAHNLGMQFHIELETGKITAIDEAVEMIRFASGAYAERDWVAQTGQTFSVLYDFTIMSSIAQDLEERYQRLLEAYGQSLTDEERLIANHILSYALFQNDGTGPCLHPELDWQKLLADLDACDSAEAFQAILHGGYPYFTQMPPDEPTRDEILAAATPTLEALGYGDLPLRSFLYNGLMGGNFGFYDIVATNAFDSLRRGLEAGEVCVTATFNSEGKVWHLYRNSYGPAAHRDPFTIAERETVADIVWNIAVEYLAFPGTPLEGSVRVAEKGFENDSGERVVNAYVLFAEDSEQTLETGGEGYAVAMVINAVDGRVCFITEYGSQEDVEKYFMSSD